MKTLFIGLLITTALCAHEGGHGHVAEGGKFGGITAPVVLRDQAGLGNKAQTLYKAELVRSEAGQLRLYVFDAKMKPLDLTAFGEEVEARLEVKKKGKFTYVGEFKLKRHGTHFLGELPKLEQRPFNIDLFLTNGPQKLFAGFSNLD